MKKINVFVLGLGLLTLLLATSCKDDESEKSNYTYDNQKYYLTYGSIQKKDTNTLHTPNTYNFEIVVAGKGISYDETAQQHVGTGNYLVFDLVSSEPENIEEGSYAFDGFASCDSLTFVDGILGINHDIANGTTGETREIKTGIINLSRKGNVFIIDFIVYTSDDKAVEGFYNGFLNEI